MPCFSKLSDTAVHLQHIYTNELLLAEAVKTAYIISRLEKHIGPFAS